MQTGTCGLIGIAAGLLLGTVSSATAQAERTASLQTGIVVELYTSQGCSSCPPADAYMSELVRRGDVIALALHVDYWDYLGWADPFAKPAFTDRQKRYARAAGAKMIYTPQIIIAGHDRIEGLRKNEIAEAVRAHAALPSRVDLRLERVDAMLRITASADPPLDGKVTVQLVRYAPKRTLTIERGENAGHTGTYHNIVTDWQALADWKGQGPLQMEVRAEGGEPVVVILQEPGPGRIVAAAQLR